VEANYAAIDLELDQSEAHDKKVTL
jgi:hypothetical protein